MLYGKRILLIIGGGIAAYKSLELIRRFRERGAKLRCVLTNAGEEFVTPLSVSALSGEKVYRDLFDLTDEAEMGHIQLSRSADLIVVAPATADLMAKMAQGVADDLASTLLLATDTPVLIAPAMNVRMWTHTATQRNLEALKRDGVAVVGPDEGAMACGEYGPGRMAEPDHIVKTAFSQFFLRARASRLTGVKALVTSGPTHEPIDPVRYIANRSSGKQGVAIAEALAARGAQVTFITGPAEYRNPEGCDIVQVRTAIEMLDACLNALPAKLAICAAAVADWRVCNAASGKIKKQAGDSAPPMLELVENPDILATLSGLEESRRPEMVVGFAAETSNVLGHARDKLARKGCDWIIANDVSAQSGVMGGDENAAILITGENIERWERMTKQAVAERIAERAAQELRQRRRAQEGEAQADPEEAPAPKPDIAPVEDNSPVAATKRVTVAMQRAQLRRALHRWTRTKAG